MRLQAMVAIMLLGGTPAHAQKSDAEMFQDAQRLYATGNLLEAEKSFTEIGGWRILHGGLPYAFTGAALFGL